MAEWGGKHGRQPLVWPGERRYRSAAQIGISRQHASQNREFSRRGALGVGLANRRGEPPTSSGIKIRLAPARRPLHLRGQLQSAAYQRWAAKIASLDAFIFVSPEYNHGVSGALKNAIDFLYAEWNNKAAGFVSYGSAGGARAVEQLRGILAEAQVATVRAQVMLSLATDFENYATFKPDPRHEKSLGPLLDQVIAWGGALKTLR